MCGAVSPSFAACMVILTSRMLHPLCVASLRYTRSDGDTASSAELCWRGVVLALRCVAAEMRRFGAHA